jgi:signal transduction histidine kinase
MIGGALIIIIISASGGFLVLRRSLRQIDTITKNVKEIDEKRLHLRMNMKGKDPISRMAGTFDDMLDKIEASFKSQRQFIQNASHELNTPLTVIKTRIDALRQKKGISKKEYSKVLDLIDSEIMRLSKMTEELLILSRLEENCKTDFKVLYLENIINKVVEVFESRLKITGSKVIIKIEEGARIRGNEGKIQQLIFNLMDNAAKYCIKGTEILINTKHLESDNRLMLEVSNQAENIDDEVISNIFERFYKDKKQEHTKGYGLGLSIAKKIVEIHDGRISAEYSNKDRKIRIKVLFPAIS